MDHLKQVLKSTATAATTAIRLDEQTNNRLVEFPKPDEAYPALINRLIDIVEEKKAAVD